MTVGFKKQSELHEIYEGCHALVYPSLRESFGLPLIESKSFGLDIIASELDYVRDVVQPNETFNPYSSVSIARAIARYLGLIWPSSCQPVLAKALLEEVFNER